MVFLSTYTIISIYQSDLNKTDVKKTIFFIINSNRNDA